MDTYSVASQLNIWMHLYVFNWTTFSNMAFLELSHIRHYKAVDKKYWIIIIVITITVITVICGDS